MLKKVEEDVLYLHFTVYVNDYRKVVLLSIQCLMKWIRKVHLPKNGNR